MEGASTSWHPAQAGVALVQSDGGRVVRGHFGRSHMDWRSGREQRTVRLFFKVAVSALDVGLAKASSVTRLMRIVLAVVVMPPSLTRGLPESSKMLSAGV